MRSTKEQHDKVFVSPPGDTLVETLEAMGISYEEFSSRSGWDKDKVESIMKGNRNIDVHDAVVLERVLGIPVSFWLEREYQYRLHIAMNHEENYLKANTDWLKSFPVKEMRKLGWLPDESFKPRLLEYLLKFFGVASHDQWENVYFEEGKSYYSKLRLSPTTNTGSVFAWLRQGYIQGKDHDLPPFKKNVFKSKLAVIKFLAFNHPIDYKAQLTRLCAEAGINLVFTPIINDITIEGSCRWINGTPCIQLSNLFSTNDQLWTAFFILAGHIFLHDKTDIFLKKYKGGEIDPKKEQEAVEFAEEYLVSMEQMKELKRQGFSDENILAYSNQLNTHPGIIIGHLQKNRLLRTSDFDFFKIDIDIDLD
ncbi:MAG: ImmA/IrrE family metallo-endopeptidase [Hyphomicrobiales bacterium]